MERATGNANATGGVKATYRQSSGQQQPFTGTGPVHVVADHAHLDHATDLTTFYGKSGELARLWQGSDSISAPVLELSRVRATLAAHGPGGRWPRRSTPYSPVLPAARRRRRPRLPEPLKPLPSPPWFACKAVLSFTPTLTTRRFSVAGWWRRLPPAFCIRVSWMSTSARRRRRDDSWACDAGRQDPGSAGQPGLEDRRPGRRRTAAAGPQGHRRRTHLHRGGWQVCAHGNECYASAPHRSGARNSNRGCVDFQ